MIIELILSTGMKFDRKIAENLYLGVVSDSDRFLISYTTAKTFSLVAKLIEKSQIDFTNLYPYLYIQNHFLIHLNSLIRNHET